MTRELAVPDEAVMALAQWDAGTPVPHVEKGHLPTVVRAIAEPVVTAELLAFADAVAALHGNGGPTYRDGYDRAVGDVRDLIADRLAELGVKVEEL